MKVTYSDGSTGVIDDRLEKPIRMLAEDLHFHSGPNANTETERLVHYIAPKFRADNPRVFNFLPCEVRNFNDDWIPGNLVCVNAINLGSHQFTALVKLDFISYQQCRLLEFGPNNPPPVDTLVKVCDLPGQCSVRHFSHFEDNKICCFVDGKSSSTCKDSESWSEYSFTDFVKSDFELIS